MSATAEKTILPINVGPLNGLGSLCFHAAKTLSHFSDLYREGHVPKVVWDLRNVQPRHMSMAGLTAFLATAYRLRKFTTNAPSVQVSWNPQVFSFWEDISLFRIVSEHDIFRWPDAVTGGSWFGDTNPNTELLMFEYKEHVPDRSDNLDYWKTWKDTVRQKFKDLLLLRCGRLFESTWRSIDFPEKLKDQVAVASAELVVNSILWGGSAAFVGLQRTSNGITVAVCDSGHGFFHSLYAQESSKQKVYPQNNLEALVIGSLINTREYGLRRVINTVIQNGGKVLMSSYDSELHWKEPLWMRIQQATIETEGRPVDLGMLTQTIGSPVTGSPTDEDRRDGFCRLWNYGLRGVRIAFEIPLRREEQFR
ncbi:MAG: hypothetical protein QOE77_3298 [Blastocatellia bacterium]|jgi:hypothetical protein|nr:hypothetical protein [Blastocatellia bacterium]